MRGGQNGQRSHADAVGFFQTARLEHHLRIEETVYLPHAVVLPPIGLRIHYYPTFSDAAPKRESKPPTLISMQEIHFQCRADAHRSPFGAPFASHFSPSLPY